MFRFMSLSFCWGSIAAQMMKQSLKKAYRILTGKKSREVDIDSYVINMAWNDKCSFFERMARYEVRMLKESRRKEKE